MTRLKIEATSKDYCEYAPVIMSMLEGLLPGSQAGSEASVLDALTRVLVGSKAYRYGPTPDPETLVSIRGVIRQAMERNEPIPMLLPWGASKQGPYKVDIAELMALRTLKALGEMVKNHYEPGLQVVIRLEDLTDRVLFTRVPSWHYKTEEYVKTFSSLAGIVLPDATVVTESELDQYSGSLLALAGQHQGDVLEAMQVSPNYRSTILREIGWNGSLPQEQIEYYRRAYSRFYPELDMTQIDREIASYFSLSLARSKSKKTGAEMFSHSPLLAGFSPPIPGAPQDRRLYYRTVLQRFTNQHRAPWLGKGYVRIVGNEGTPAIAGWDGDGLDYHRFDITVSNGDNTAYISADYTILE